METVTLNDILYALLTMAVPLILSYVIQLVSEFIADSKHKDAVKTVFDAVVYVNQTFVDELKRAGNFDAEAQKTAFEKAKNAALDTMRNSTYKWLDKVYIDLDSWFEVQIERAVNGAKGGA